LTRPGIIYVFIQFAAIAVLLLYTDFHLFSWIAIFQFIAIALAAWASWELKKSMLSIFPELKKGAQLITTGPYHTLRHPMYSALLLFFLPTMIEGKETVPIVVYFVLLITLILKMRYEEKILKSCFAEYEQYAKNSFYLIPFVV